MARASEELPELFVAQGIAWVPYFPLGSAIPGVPKVTDNPIVQGVAQRLGATPAQVGLAWLLQHAPKTLLIPGTAELSHLQANGASRNVQLDQDAIAALNGV